VCFKASAANLTTAPTINVYGLGAKTIVTETGVAVTAGGIQASGYYWVQRDDSSAKFVLISNPSKEPAFCTPRTHKAVPDTRSFPPTGENS